MIGYFVVVCMWGTGRLGSFKLVRQPIYLSPYYPLAIHSLSTYRSGPGAKFGTSPQSVLHGENDIDITSSGAEAV